MALLASIVLPFSAAHAQSIAPQTVHVNDVIKIEVWRNPELSGTFTVRADSALGHPLYNQIKAAGLTSSELVTRVGEFLTRFGTNPQFDITHMVPVSIGGEVRQPDVYLVPVGSSFATVFGQAGGPTQQADLAGVRLLRSNVTMTLDLTAANAAGFSTVLKSGDQIMVPRNVSVLREYIAPVASILGAIGVVVNILLK